MSDEVKRRGRPPHTPEEKSLRNEQRKKAANEWHKKTGYAAQKKYRETHPDKVAKQRKQNYEPKIRIPLEFRPNLDELLSKTGMTITELFVGAVEEKYAITLSNPVDKSKKK